MKANELMIGDYVTFADCQNDKYPSIVKIWQINEAGEAFVSIDGDDLEEIAIDDEVVGIPITPEILEENGFEKQSRYQWKYRDNSCTIEISIAPKIEIEGEVLGPSPINVIIEGALFELNKTDDWYVHELQHALRLCGIDKEIEL